MTKNYSNRQNPNKYRKIWAPLLVLCCFATIFCLLWLVITGEPAQVKTNTLFKIGVRLMPFGIFVLFASFPQTPAWRGYTTEHAKMFLSDRIVFATSSIILFLNFVLPTKTYCTICVVFATIICLYAGICFFVQFKLDEDSFLLGISGLCAVCIAIPPFFNIMYIESIDSLLSPWIMRIILVAGLLFSLAYVILRFVKKRPFQKKYYPLLIVFATCLAFVVLPFLTAKTLNYTLDKSTPTLKSFQIVDKYQKRGTGSRHRGISYHLVVDIDGQPYDLNLPKSIFDSKQKNDFLVISFYQGAFGAEYFIPDEIDKYQQ